MLTGAALGDRFGRRRLYVTGLAVFTAASIACATASSAGALIAARTVQGAGAAIVLPVSLTLISEAFPAEKRGTAIGIWGGITGLGVATAPLLGGAIIQGIDWQWIFWINVPVGVVSAVASAVLLTESRGPRPRLDLVGLPLIIGGLFALVWAPVRAPSTGWGSGEVTGALIVGAVLVAAFVFWERRAPVPMMPVEYFRRRAFSAAGAVAFPFSFALIGSVFWIAQMLQVGMGYSPLASGIRMLVFTMMPMIFAPLGGLASDRVGTRPVMTGGLLLMGGGYLWLALTVQGRRRLRRARASVHRGRHRYLVRLPDAGERRGWLRAARRLRGGGRREQHAAERPAACSGSRSSPRSSPPMAATPRPRRSCTGSGSRSSSLARWRWPR